MTLLLLHSSLCPNILRAVFGYSGICLDRWNTPWSFSLEYISACWIQSTFLFNRIKRIRRPTTKNINNKKWQKQQYFLLKIQTTLIWLHITSETSKYCEMFKFWNWERLPLREWIVHFCAFQTEICHWPYLRNISGHINAHINSYLYFGKFRFVFQNCVEKARNFLTNVFFPFCAIGQFLLI